VADIGQVKRAADRAAELTHQLLAFARREVVRPRPIDLNAVVDSVRGLLVHTLGEHVELTVQLGDGVPHVLADAGQLEQVLVNLAVNGRDAMPDGGRLEIATGAVHVDEASSRQHDGIEPGRYVRLQVSDTGTGMTRDVAERAFEPFFTTKPKGSGTGLGLATVYGIITQAGGAARLYSEPGMGTTFTALLPVTDDAAPVEEQQAEAPPRALGAEVVLVVEDEDLVREVALRVLRRAGYQVLTAPDGPTAIRLAAAHDGPIDALLCDVVMPKMLGREVAERIVAERPGTSVVFMSGYAEPVLGARGTLDPGMRLVEKPFTESDLLAAVRAALDAR
jgi:CheY-like chemotaxis protein